MPRPVTARPHESRDTEASVSPLDQLDRRLGAWQRQRVIVYFAIAATLVALSFAMGTFQWPTADPERPDDPIWRIESPAVRDFADTFADGLMTLSLLCGLLVSLPRRRTHQEVVATLQVTLVALTALIFAPVVLFVAPLPWPERLGLATLGGLAGLPGLIWSVARSRRFQDRFVAWVLRRRANDIDRDLAHARRLHESLLPTLI